METLTTLKVLHVAATVVILASGLVLAALTWRNRSEGPASTMRRPWLFIWCLMLIGMLTANSDAAVRLHDGRDAFHGTSPIAWGAPVPGDRPRWSIPRRVMRRSRPPGTPIDGRHTR